MATIDEHIEYLKDSARFPKVNKKAITDPTSQFSGAEYNRIIDAMTQIRSKEAELRNVVNEFTKQKYEVLEQPVFMMTDSAYDILEGIGATMEDGIYLTYDMESSSAGVVEYNEEVNILHVGGSTYSDTSGLLKLAGATYNESTGYIKL